MIREVILVNITILNIFLEIEMFLTLSQSPFTRTGHIHFSFWSSPLQGWSRLTIRKGVKLITILRRVWWNRSYGHLLNSGGFCTGTLLIVRADYLNLGWDCAWTLDFGDFPKHCFGSDIRKSVRPFFWCLVIWSDSNCLKLERWFRAYSR